MKKLIFAFLLLLSAFGANAQLYAPCYANYSGIGYFQLANGYYYGQIYGGYPQGEGYYYFVDPQLGAVFYHGYFDKGLCNGSGEIVSNQGYICGNWSQGNFVSQTNVQSYQMQQSYYDVWSNYWNYFATTPNYSYNYLWDWNLYSYPSYNSTYTYPTYTYPSFDYNPYNAYTPSYSYPSSNYQAKNDVKIPKDTKIVQIDSDTQLGRQLLGKIRR